MKKNYFVIGTLLLILGPPVSFVRAGSPSQSSTWPFKVQDGWDVMEYPTKYRDIREVDFENRIYALRDSPRGFVQLRNGEFEQSLPWGEEDIGIASTLCLAKTL